MLGIQLRSSGFGIAQNIRPSKDMLPQRLKATYQEMGMQHKSDSSSTHSSSNDLSAHDEGDSQPVQEAPLPANQ